MKVQANTDEGIVQVSSFGRDVAIYDFDIFYKLLGYLKDGNVIGTTLTEAQVNLIDFEYGIQG